MHTYIYISYMVYYVVACTLNDCSTLKSIELANFVVQEIGAMPGVFLAGCQAPYYKLTWSNMLNRIETFPN